MSHMTRYLWILLYDLNDTLYMTRLEAVIGKLEEIEREMRRIGFWDDDLNTAKVRESALKYATTDHKSPVGTIPFENWLQAVFIPNARRSAETGKKPTSSQVSVMAMREYDYHSYVPKAQKLLQLLYEFDALI